MAIIYNIEDLNFSYEGKKRTTTNWIKKVIESETAKVGDISIIFCSDSYLLNINNKYLDHNYYTDIITFDYCDQTGENRLISGDLFISIDTVSDNAKNLDIPFDSELKRIIIHGVLHLLGYKDKNESDQIVMRAKENLYLKCF